MEYTELTAYDLPDGTVTTWAPVASGGGWRPDERALSYDHEAHLRGPGDGAWIGSVLRVPLRFDAGAVRRTLRAWVARHEVLRTAVRAEADDPTGAPRWSRETCAPAAVDVTVRSREPLPAPAVRARLLAEFATVSPTAWPHVVFATVEPEAGTPAPLGGAEEGFVLAFGADHSVMDAYSQLLWFDEVVALYARALAGDTDHDLAVLDVGSHVDFAAFDRRLGQLVSARDDAVETWGAFLAGDGEGLAFPRYPDPAVRPAAPTTPRTTGAPVPVQQSRSTWVLDAAGTDALGRGCRALGTGLQSAVLGLLARAVERETGSATSDVVVPVHTRHEPRYAGSVGWYVGLCPVHLEAPPDAATADLVRGADHAVAAVKHLAARPFARVAELLGVSDHPRFVVSYVDVRHVPGARHWDAWQARTLRSAAPDADEVYLWIIRSAHGLNVSARCPAGPVPGERLDALGATYARLLADAARELGGGGTTERAVPDLSDAASVA